MEYMIGKDCVVEKRSPYSIAKKWPALILIECSPWFTRNRLRLVKLDYLLRLLAPCWTQTPSCTTCLLHPSRLQRFTIAPCRTHTLPCTTLLPHPPWLHSFTLAPCLTQTPPCWTVLPHPPWLQFLFFLAPLSLSCLTPRTHLA